MQFAAIIGNQAIKEHLINTVKENRVSHAQLFLGPQGAGALPLALAYAQYINCENKQQTDSCGSCSSCRKYSKLIHPDLHFSYPFFAKKAPSETASMYVEEWRKAFLSNPYMSLEQWREALDPENKTKQANINIAEAHSIIKKLSLKAFEAEYKVLIMWLPEYLEKEGNALLKLIEEPPPKTLFLLVAENQDKILNTIISRTQLVKVHKLSNEQVKNYLITEKHLSSAQATELAFIADGNIQQALNTLADSTSDYFSLLVAWLRGIVTDSGLAIIKLCEEELAKLGRENQKSFLIYAINMLRQIILAQEGLNQLVFLPAEQLNYSTSLLKTSH